MKVRLLADENVDPAVVLGVIRRAEDADIVRVQDVGLRTKDDSEILQWAADEGRVLVSHDIKTIPDFAFERVADGLAMPGVLVAASTLAMSALIEELVLITVASEAEDWADRVVYLPLG